jgi:hypothetical protein
MAAEASPFCRDAKRTKKIKTEKTFSAAGHAPPKESFGPARFSVEPLPAFDRPTIPYAKRILIYLIS